MRKEDPRIKRTRILIQTAFLKLLETKAYEEITVQDILDIAEVNRSTFYKHYLNKEKLIEQIIGQLKETIILPLLEQRFSAPIKEFASIAVPLINEHRSTFRLLWQVDTQRVSLKRDFFNLVKNKYISVSQTKFDRTIAELEFQGTLFAYISVGMFEHIIQGADAINPDIEQQNIKDVLSFFDMQ
ncbi:TetR/AcrR family transcriptional regulator [Actinobacillus capsulatus]|uniref:TetR/AcrR family transcriptional regulator n=1 Tax=Actinobacillus capsulatus TaxID=717 RepID=UPI000368D18D|nr:TetR/AcrR family transcriptional regulator [Actinobacillus capsulatus]